MSEEIVSLALLEALPGKQDDLLALLREFYTMMHDKGYSRDSLHRDASDSKRFFHLRYWRSEHARTEAQGDPQVHRYWQKLPELCTITAYEKLDNVFES